MSVSSPSFVDGVSYADKAVDEHLRSLFIPMEEVLKMAHSQDNECGFFVDVLRFDYAEMGRSLDFLNLASVLHCF